MTSLRQTLAREMGRYEELQPALRVAATQVQAAVLLRLRNRWEDEGRPTVPVVYARVKPADSVRQRIEERYARLEDFPDLVGCRVVVLHSHEVDKAEAAMRGWIDLGAPNELSITSWEGRATGYSGCSWSTPVASVASSTDADPEVREQLDSISDVSWELQVHTAMQEAWARLSHGRFYKNRIGVPHRTSRKLQRLAAITDLVDEQFSLLEEDLRQETERVRHMVEARAEHEAVEIDELVLLLASRTWDGQFRRLRTLAAEAGLRQSEWPELVRIGDETDLCASVCERTGILTLGQFLAYAGQSLGSESWQKNVSRLRALSEILERRMDPTDTLSPLIDRPLQVFSLLRLIEFPDHIEGSHPLRATIKDSLKAYAATERTAL